MGWNVVERDWAGGEAWQQAGSNTMFHTVLWIAPRRNFAAVTMCKEAGTLAENKCDEAIQLAIKKNL